MDHRDEDGGGQLTSWPSFVQRFVPSPIGRLRLVATDGALVALDLPLLSGRHARSLAAVDGGGQPRELLDLLERAARQVEEYFLGERREFDVPLAPAGTPFQKAVWDEVARIPFGERRSYAEVALEIGRPRAVRAVGGANALNPLPILVPCHRVVGSDGRLTGYAGGLAAKEWLLSHEGVRAP